MLDVAPGINEPAETNVFLILICNFLTTAHHFPKHISLTSCVDSPLFIVDIDNDEINPATLSDEADSTVGAVYYKPKQNRAEGMR